MRIIPVIDILNGIAVHAIKGKRSQYRPLKSVLCNSTDPLDVAKCFDEMGFSELYIADLNSIMKNGSNGSIIKRIFSNTNLKVIIDNGLTDSKKVKQMLSFGASKVIIGTESIFDINDVRKLTEELKNQIIISLDLKKNKVLSKDNHLSEDKISALKQIENFGAREIILLDLNKVGSQEGLDFDYIKTAFNISNSKILVGGGVRNLDDIKKVYEIGLDGVLIATGLHLGKIKYRDIRKFIH